MDYPLISPNTERQIERKSSVKQYDSVFGGQLGGVWLPIVSDMIDYIDCDGIHSHQVILTDNDEYVGYEFPVENCCFYEDEYVKSDFVEDSMEPLPEEFGSGFYQSHTDVETLTNSDANSLGTHNKIEHTIGLDYYLPKKKLPAKK